MMKDQILPAFIAALIQKQEVQPETIEKAINNVLDIKLGGPIFGDNQLVRAFATEQSQRLTKGKK